MINKNGRDHQQKMYLPKVYEKFAKEYPEVFSEYKKLGIACREAAPWMPNAGI
ncbi:MAG: hypothetical protein PVH87_15335 [Desulfobacteraceae bacterium]